MNEQKEQAELSSWFSSYGLITAERILEKYHIRLAHDVLMRAVKNPESIYYRLLKVPIKNVLNGIILTQAKDYQVYAQKLFIDYLLSGEEGKEQDSPGGGTREELEERRQELMALGERFQQQERKHQQLISASQARLISFGNQWRSSMHKVVQACTRLLQNKGEDISASAIEQAISYALATVSEGDISLTDKNSQFIQKMLAKLGLSAASFDVEQLSLIFQDFFAEFKAVDESLGTYIDKTKSVAEQLRAYRNEFYEKILQISGLLNNLSDYRINEEQIKVNKESLNFDRDMI